MTVLSLEGKSLRWEWSFSSSADAEEAREIEPLFCGLLKIFNVVREIILLNYKMSEIKPESMEVNEGNDAKNEKTENKLAFSIDSLLADKFVKDGNAKASTSDAEYFCVFNKDNVNVDSDEDKESSGSEQLDVESSTTGDAQEFENKPSEYQSGIYFFNRLKIIDKIGKNKTVFLFFYYIIF